MTSQKQQPCYTALEVPQPALVNATKQPTRSQLKLLAQKLIYWLVVKPELTVKQKVDCGSNAIWYVYDSTTERSASLASEEEVRIWIEERFYYPNRPSQDALMNFDCYQVRLFR